MQTDQVQVTDTAVGMVLMSKELAEDLSHFSSLRLLKLTLSKVKYEYTYVVGTSGANPSSLIVEVTAESEQEAYEKVKKYAETLQSDVRNVNSIVNTKVHI